MSISTTQVQALAGFRNALRRFLAFSEEATQSAGVTALQYQAMLAIKAQPLESMLLGKLAEELLLKPNGAVQLVDRLTSMGLVQRNEPRSDRKTVRVSLTVTGDSLFLQLATLHLDQLSKRKKQLAVIVRQLKQVRSHEPRDSEGETVPTASRRRAKNRVR